MRYAIVILTMTPSNKTESRHWMVNSRSPREAESKALEEANVWNLPDGWTFMTQSIYNVTKRNYEGVN